MAIPFLGCIATGIGWCCCTAVGSLISSWCGTDKPSNVPPSATSGRKRSIFLLLLTIILSIIFQYIVGPYIMDLSITNYVTNAWTDGCITNLTDDTLQEKCVGNNGVYRVTFATLVFFVMAAIAAYCKPTANREAWAAKFAVFFLLIFGCCFIPNDPLFSSIYLIIARIGGVVFIIVQQVIILDIAYNWNESWVNKSNTAETEKIGKRWLGAILASCVILFLLTFVGIGLLFAYYGGCTNNDTFIALTLIFSIILTIIQVSFSEEGSLLSSAIIACYGTYLCFTAVTKNPNSDCNPNVGENRDILNIVLGVIVTLLGLAWTGYSATAERRVGITVVEEDDEEKEGKKNNNDDKEEEEDRKVQGIVTNANNDNDEEQPSLSSGQDIKPVSWRINIILAIISCWIAMALTGWGDISESSSSLSNPDVSSVSMWLIIASQWLMFVLYLWTLIAPKVLSNRDFD